MTEERKLTQEEGALRTELKRLALELVAVIDDPGSDTMDLKEHFGALVRWKSVVKEGDVAEALWDEIRRVVGGGYWRVIENHLLQRDIIAARVRAEGLVEFLDRYEELFGLKPPEEEEAPEEIEAEVEPIEEPADRPWEALHITEEMWNRPLLDLLGEGREATRIDNCFARFRGVTAAGRALKILNEEEWRPGCVKFIGPKRITLLREAFVGAGYSVQGYTYPWQE